MFDYEWVPCSKAHSKHLQTIYNIKHAQTFIFSREHHVQRPGKRLVCFRVPLAVLTPTHSGIPNFWIIVELPLRAVCAKAQCGAQTLLMESCWPAFLHCHISVPPMFHDLIWGLGRQCLALFVDSTSAPKW